MSDIKELVKARRQDMRVLLYIEEKVRGLCGDRAVAGSILQQQPALGGSKRTGRRIQQCSVEDNPAGAQPVLTNTAWRPECVRQGQRPAGPKGWRSGRTMKKNRRRTRKARTKKKSSGRQPRSERRKKSRTGGRSSKEGEEPHTKKHDEQVSWGNKVDQI